MRFHCTALVVALVLSAAAAAAQPAPLPAPGEAAFTIVSRGMTVGRQQVVLSRDASGWIITVSGRLEAPVDLSITRFEMKYAPDWQPLELKIDAIQRRAAVSLATSFALTTAINEITQQGRTVAKEDQISARTIVLPADYYGAYEALAARLWGLDAGAEVPIYVAPQGETRLTVRTVTPQTLTGPAGSIETRRYGVSIANRAGGAIDAVVTADSRARLVKLEIPAIGLMVVREDVSSVAVRTQLARNPTDTDVQIPANGFVLAGTVTSPPTVAGRLRYPGVVLVGPAASRDRDVTVDNTPVFTHLAKGLADAGHVVVRYDNRGAGQSGGRVESATLSDFAADAATVVKWLRGRKDVDDRHLLLVGYAEGANVALLAAAQQKDVDGVVTIDAAGVRGAELLLEQQHRMLDKMSISDADKKAKIALQEKIQNAVLSGSGWEGVPDAMRRQADTPLFKSQLAFDPAQALSKVRQPLLIIQADADDQIPAASAEKLASLVRTRKKVPAPEIVHVPGATRALVTGAERTVNARFAQAIAEWARKN